MQGGRGPTRGSKRPPGPGTGDLLRAVLAIRCLIVVAALGGTAVCALLRDDWRSFATDYLYWDFGFSNLACFDLARSGRNAVLWHLAIAAGWIAAVAWLTPWIGERLAAPS
jgi:hypothetical protein